MKPKLNFDILESLRGMAALYVCIGHCRGVLWIGGDVFAQLHPKETWTWIDYLQMGLNMLTRLSPEFVIVFFVLSGFSISHSLKNNSRTGEFYLKRFLRLYPPYFMALLWAILVISVIQSVWPSYTDGTYQTPAFDRLQVSNGLLTWSQTIKNLFYIPQLGGIINPFWSLTQEVIFYLLAPYLLKNRKLYYLFTVTGFGFYLLNGYVGHGENNILMNFLFYNVFFAIGNALYYHYEWILSKFKWLAQKKALALSAFLFFIMIGVSLKNLTITNSFLAAALSVILIIHLLAANLRINWLVGVGRFSYTLYITHFPTIFVYMALFFTITGTPGPFIYNNLVFIPCVFLCLLVAYLQYLLVEKRTKSYLEILRGGKQNLKLAVTRLPFRGKQRDARDNNQGSSASYR